MAQTKLSVNLVAVDIGNSAIKVGYFHGSDLISKDVYKLVDEMPSTTFCRENTISFRGSIIGYQI